MSDSIKYTRLFQAPNFCPYCGERLTQYNKNDFKKSCPKCSYYYWDYRKECLAQRKIIVGIKKKYNILVDSIQECASLAEAVYYANYAQLGQAYGFPEYTEAYEIAEQFVKYDIDEDKEGE